jgi:hypothetical protein
MTQDNRAGECGAEKKGLVEQISSTEFGIYGHRS